MIKLIYIGDPHIRGTNPRNHTGDYKQLLINTFREVFKQATENGVKAILCAGDMFDKPEVSTGVLLEFADVMNESPVPIYTTPGNHDLYSYNLSTFWRSSLALIERLVPQVHVIQDPGKPILINSIDCGVSITFTPFTSEMDRDGYGYSPEVDIEGYYKIHVAHGMLLDHTPPFDRFTLVQEVKTTADLVLTGHDHIGYGIYNRPDGKVFANIGSLSYLAASVGEMERTIQSLLIEVGPGNTLQRLETQQLHSALTGPEVLDRSKIEAEQKRQYAMEQFSALIQTKTGDAVLLDIDGIVEQIAAQEELKPEVVQLALEKINDAKAKL